MAHRHASPGLHHGLARAWKSVRDFKLTAEPARDPWTERTYQAGRLAQQAKQLDARGRQELLLAGLAGLGFGRR
ncbi:MAG: hypothetical protein JJ902_17255 [Roseibium sp.]|nr:hypothetical protein [Roseibium sp.]